MTDRDPRVEPRVGDRLMGVAPTRPKVAFIRRVMAVRDDLVVGYWHEYYDRFCYCGPAAWRRWAKNAEVITKAMEVEHG